MSPRALLKGVAQRSLVASGLAALWRRVIRADTVILAYHNVIPDGNPPEGDASLHLPLSDFRRQLDTLSRTHSIVPLPELLSQGNAGGGPRAAVTFDDAYRGCLELALPELLSRGLPCTVFVAPALLGGRRLWWDLVADSSSGAVPWAFRERALTQLGGRQEEVLEAASQERVVAAPVSSPFSETASEAELLQAAESPLVSLGSHGWSHLNLAAVPADEAEAEMRLSLEWLRGQGVKPPFLLSYPYGAYRASLGRLARAVGFEYGLRVSGGPRPAAKLTKDPYAVPRLNVPRGVSIEGLILRVSGMTGR